MIGKRTRSSAALASVVPSSAPTSVPEDNRNRGGGVGKGAMTDSAGALLEEGEGTFSDFAKSLRDFRGELDLSPVTSGGEEQQVQNEAGLFVLMKYHMFY